MRRLAAAALLTALAACHRPQADQPTLDAAADAQARTAAKTRDDLAAASGAAQGPVPDAAVVRPWKQAEDAGEQPDADDEPQRVRPTASAITPADDGDTPPPAVPGNDEAPRP